MLGVFLNFFYWLCSICSASSPEMEREEPTPSEDQTYRASSSSTSPCIGDYEGGTQKTNGNNYEVFLSFRGRDTRKGFTDHLYMSLVDAGIRVFRDDNDLPVGEEIGEELLCSIRQSKISIPIISEDYSSSKWCLRELAQMLKCRKSNGQIVLPIFYKVEPSQLRHLSGRLGDSINRHKANLDKNTVKEWEEALKEVANLKGWESEKTDNGHEGALVKTVVRKVMSELKRPFQLIVPEKLVGIDARMEEIMSSTDHKFNGTRIIGIHGMGGVGKTTLAKVLYNELSCKYGHRSFIANIRETSLRKGIECLQNQLISDVLGNSWNVSNVDEGIHVIRSCFIIKKVLLLLDDMDDISQLNALAGDGSWFGDGSIVIVTSRDKSILDETRGSHIYQLDELPLDQSLILFSRHAFREDFPRSDYVDISRHIVSTTGGLPLALEVIGSFLCGKRKEVWEDTLKKLKKVPHKKVQEKLKISYDALDYEERQIFLDIACFLIGSHKQSPIYMWDACDFFPTEGIEVLSLLSLIKIDELGNLMMHDQLRDLGRQIVREENPKEPRDRSRLWNYKDAEDVLDNNKGTRMIEALCLGESNGGRSYMAEQFKELANLRFFQMNGGNLTGDFHNLFPQLRWLQWQYCLSDFTAGNFYPKKLVVLDLSHSEISEYWGGWGPLKMATALKVLNLTDCRYMRSTPELSAFKSLEILILEGCLNLKEIHPSIGDIKMLISLNVKGCRALKELPAGIGKMENLRELILDYSAIRNIPISRGYLMKLETLSARGCGNLAQIPESMGSLASLIWLDLSESGIEALPKTIGSLKELKVLDVSHGKLAQLPNSMASLTSLTKLDLAWTAIAKLPESIVNLQNLKILLIAGTHITELPREIGMLAKLQELNVWGCKNLEGLPSNIAQLTSLDKLRLGYSGISSLPEIISKLSSLQLLDFEYSAKIQEVPKLPFGLRDLSITSQSRSLPHLSQLTLLNKLSLSNCSRLDCLPELPVGLSLLRITGCRKLKALPNLSSLKRLSVLSLARCFELTEVTGLEGLHSLSSLHVLECPKIFRPGAVESLESSRGFRIEEALSEGVLDFSHPKVLRETIAGNFAEIYFLGVSKSSLTSDISECTSAGQSQDLSCLECVRESQSTNCLNLTEIHSLDGLMFLEFLDISGSTSLAQSLDLSNLKSLRVFYAEDCKNLVEIQGLDGSKSLVILSISGCTSLGQSLTCQS